MNLKLVALTIILSLLVIPSTSATISFDDDEQIYRITRIMAGGNQGITGGTSAFDYFNDASVVDDVIYFNSVMKKYSGLKINVGTALSAASITVVWEYHTSVGWVALSGVNDTSNTFQNTGSHEINWTMPINWYNNPTITGDTSSSRGYNVRCRITAVSGITEGGANSVSTVKEKTYAIWIKDGATHSLEDIYDADVAGGWGMMTKDMAEKSYLLNANLYIYDGQLNIKDHETLTVGKKPGKYAEHMAIEVPNSGILQLGEKSASGLGYNGGKLIWNNGKSYGTYLTWTGNINMYGSYFWVYGGGYTALTLNCELDIVDTFWDTGTTHTWYLPAGSSGSFERALIAGYYLYVYSGSLTFTDTSMTKISTGASNTPYGVLAGNAAYFAKITGMDFQNSMVSAVTQQASLALINCDNLLDSKVVMSGTYTKPEHLHRRFTFNLKVINELGNPIENATITLTDTDGRSALFEDVKVVHTNARLSLSSVDDTTASVIDGTRYTIGEILRIRGELMEITNIIGNILTVTRNLTGSTATGILNTCAPYIRQESIITNINGSIFYDTDKNFEITIKDFPRVNGVNQPIKDFNPFTLTIEKDGYQTYETIINITEKTDWTITMLDYPFIINGTIVINQADNTVIIRQCAEASILLFLIGGFFLMSRRKRK